jgi:hypothetical protein
MASRKEERERLRQQRMSQQQSRGSSERQRLILGYAVAGVLTLAVLVGLVLVIAGGGDEEGVPDTPENAHIDPLTGTFDGLEPDNREGTPPPELQFGDLEESAQQAGCTLQRDLPIEGSTHVENKESVTYKTNPPTSGNHNPEPAADGAFLTPVKPADADGANVRNLVHAMEHGRIQIQYQPSLPEDQQLALKGVLDDNPGGMMMFPNPEMKDPIAFTAWGQLVTCKAYDPLVLDVLRNFRDTYRGNGPENVPF